MALIEGTTRDALGGIVICSRMRTSPSRLDYEKILLPAVEVGLPGWERAHSQGKITGVESPNAIRYAPAEVNQIFQRLGIEGFISELFKMKAPETELWLTTVTYTHPMTLRLKEIQYRVDAVVGDVTKTLFEASIEIQDNRQSPRVTIGAQMRLPLEEWLPLIKNTAAKTAKMLDGLRDLVSRIQNQADLYKGEHQMQIDLVKNSVAGYLTNRIFNSLPPPIEIWKETFNRVTAARQAINQRDLKKATKEAFMARAQYLFAMKKYRIWKDGIESAGTQMQIAIGVVAVMAVLAAVGLYAVDAPVAEVSTSAAAGESAAAAEQAAVRLRVATQELEAAIKAAEALSEAQEAALAEQYAESAAELSVRFLIR